jgi:hypothetical protein
LGFTEKTLFQNLICARKFPDENSLLLHLPGTDYSPRDCRRESQWKAAVACSRTKAYGWLDGRTKPRVLYSDNGWQTWTTDCPGNVDMIWLSERTTIRQEHFGN